MRDSGASASDEVARWSRGAERPVRRWLVLEAGPNPSTDYFVRSRLDRASEPVRYRSLDEVPAADDLSVGTFVVVVRYLTPRWALALARARSGLAGVAYFMDDDLWDPSAHAGLPLGYRFRMWRRASAYRGLVRSAASHLWFSSPALLEKYPDQRAELLDPRPTGEPVRALARQDGPVRVVYHGTRAHLAEMRWLAPIVRLALERSSALEFEVVGGSEVRRIFDGLPRLRVVPAMSWPEYRRYASRLEAHIALAPLLPSPFNRTRTFTKAFDHARLGAVGIYSSPGPYDAAVTHERNGLLLPIDPDAWVGALVALAGDRERLRRLRVGAAELAR